jgi:hypothetical protein
MKTILHVLNIPLCSRPGRNRYKFVSTEPTPTPSDARSFGKGNGSEHSTIYTTIVLAVRPWEAEAMGSFSEEINWPHPHPQCGEEGGGVVQAHWWAGWIKWEGQDVYFWFFSLFNFRFSLGVCWATFCCSLLPLSLLPLSPISAPPCLIVT